jgi:Domain of unknown function (DUF5666)
MERPKIPGTPLVFLVVGLLAGVSPAAAQTKTAQGTVTAVSARSLTVKVANVDMTFAIDDKTVVEAPGAGTQTRRQGGVKVTDFVKSGGNVVVTYNEANGVNRATSIRTVSSPGGSGPETKVAAGTVKAVSAASLTVTSGGKDMTFSVTRNTRVLGQGAGRATREAGGSIPITGLVSSGDTVSVSYTEAGSTMSASEVRVTVKAR